ncbi:MAG TPA: protein translocase subunit SecD [Anaerolineaceae bacterium]|nr:MAG: protein-export membrane protein SecD [Chloroflexi bacterium GWB2_54_36]HAL17436.1 protein translocase subunit SecD [Anaerolineaceae bacterium]
MNRRYVNLIIILLLLALSIWIDLPSNPGIKIGSFERSLETVLGLDLRGGMQVILSVPSEIAVTQQNLQDAAQILENRSNALGVDEVVYQTAGERIIVGEYPGASNAEDVIGKIKETGQLEFVDFGDVRVPEGTVVETDFGLSASAGAEATPTVEVTPTTEATATAEATPEATPTETTSATRYHTVLTGANLKSVSVVRGQLNDYTVALEFDSEGADILKEWTTANVGKILGIVLDKAVISSPSVNNPIPDGQAEIIGSFTNESANALAVQLRYGSLPIPLEIEQIRVIGPTLGQDSLDKSLLAGIIGFGIVMLFMGIYYRVPGVVADLAIIFYALITFAIFKLVPVTLTLPGIAGFLLSTGSALDANILIFERLKEELRNGRTMRQAIDLAWRRAWPSIRDSNIAALITAAILFWFGSTFGASFVKGFALTLALGVGVSLMTAFTVTRTLLGLVVDLFKDPEQRPGLFGL